MRIPACLAASVLSLSLWVPRAEARVVEKIVAVVGDAVILQSEIEEKAAPFLRQIAGITNQQERAARAEALRREVLDRLIDDELIANQGREMKITIAADEVDRMVDQIKRENNLDDKQLADALAGQNMSMASYRQDVKRQILRYRVLQMAVGSKTQISDREIEAYYDRHMKASDSEVRASHMFIAIPDNADAGTLLERQQLAESLRKRVEAGEDFAELAKKYSEDAATRDEGGDLGFFGRDLLPKPIEEVVFTMKIGEVRGPIRADRGFHVIKLVDRREKPAKPLAEATEEIRGRLRQKNVEKETKTFLTDLRSRVLVDIRM
ncbi:MAG: peptidylprolyl isomerase [Deltaproteobacteria bacterium]|nr:peptidylprolyl isomerase [Deltaproteobacteria bacterium]